MCSCYITLGRDKNIEWIHTDPDTKHHYWKQRGCNLKEPSEDEKEKPWKFHPYADFYRMTKRDRIDLMWEFPKWHVIALSSLGTLLLGSQGALRFHGHVFQKALADKTKTDQRQDEDPMAPTMR